MKLFSFLLLAFLFTMGSCRFLNGEKIYGDGNITSRQLQLGDFTSLDASGAVKIYVSQGAAHSVKIETDNNLHEYLDVYTKGSQLVVESKDGASLHPSKDIRVYVTAPEWRELEVSGACDIIGVAPITTKEELYISGSGATSVNLDVNTPKLVTEVSGSSNINLKGTASSYEAKASGASEIRAFDLNADDVILDLSGACDAELSANTKMDVSASGASSVRYKGAAAVTQQVSGAGSVKRIQ